jgi:hypothetical protein
MPKAIEVMVEYRYKMKDGFVTEFQNSMEGETRYVFSDSKGDKLANAKKDEKGYFHPKLISSFIGRIVDQGEVLYFIKDDWTYRLKRVGLAIVS